MSIHKGELEIDHERGVIYFNTEEGTTLLRICSLPKPIPYVEDHPDGMLDVTHMHGCNWGHTS